MRSLLRSVAVAVALVAGARVEAQTLRGVVRDSASRQALAGAVLTLHDAAGVPLGQSVTNERGEFRMARSDGARSMRVRRIGYQPRELPLPADADAPLHVAVATIPSMLTAVNVTGASRCTRRSDRAALALWQQARDGLLATVVGREANPGSMKLLAFERTRSGTEGRIVKQSVRIDSGGGRDKGFSAAARAMDFVRAGFARDSAGQRVYYGPDADVLLDDAFATGYCFSIASADRRRPTEVGLSFVPARRVAGRVDIEGQLWVDTAARALRDIEFRYVGLERRIEAERPGGRVTFREMPNGIVLVDDWSFRLIDVGRRETADARGRETFVEWLYARDVGGRIARAEWPDGTTWTASLGTLRAHVEDRAGKPVRRALIRLADTDYLANVDYKGDVEIPDLLDGPYTAMIVDTALARLGVALSTSARFVAEGDSVIQLRIVAPPATGTIACTPSNRHLLLAIRFVASDGTPVTDAAWELGEQLGEPDEVLVASGPGGEDGIVRVCPPAESAGLALRAWRVSDPHRVQLHSLGQRQQPVVFTFPRGP